MEFAKERELVHLRYELRQLLADGRREDAAPLLERLRQIAQAADDGCGPGNGGGDHSLRPTADSGRALPLDSEIARWTTSFNL